MIRSHVPLPEAIGADCTLLTVLDLTRGTSGVTSPLFCPKVGGKTSLTAGDLSGTLLFLILCWNSVLSVGEVGECCVDLGEG